MAAEKAEIQKNRMLGILATIFTLMTLAATITTAYSVQQASIYGGEGTSSTTEAIGLRSLSSSYLSKALEEETIDVNTFVNWVTAISDKNTELASFIEKRFREEFKPAFYAQLNSANETEIPLGTPFDRPEYKNANLEMSRQIDLEIDALVEKGNLYSKNANRLVLVTVLMAIVVFLTTLGESKKRLKYLRIAILSVAIALFLFSLSIIISIPFIWLY